MIYLATFIFLAPIALAALFVLWARTRSSLIAAPALVLDVLVNFTWAWAIWGWPERGEWTITKRLKRQQFDAGRRGVWAWKLAHWLNRHDPGHV